MKIFTFKTVIIALIALTLTGGVALADTLWADFYGPARLLDITGNDTQDVWDAYSVSFFFDEWGYTEVGGNTELPTDWITFKFRGSDDLTTEVWGNPYKWLTGYSDPFDSGDMIFKLEIDGFTFSIDKFWGDCNDGYCSEYDDKEWYIEFNESLLNGYQFVNMYLTGWINGITPVNYNIQIEQSDAYLGYSWGVMFFSDFEYLPDSTPAVPEPGTLALFSAGLLGVAIAARRKMKK